MRKIKHVVSLAAALLLVALCFSGCDGGKKPVGAIGSAAPQSLIAGYYSATQTVNGGTDLRFINLRDIKIDKTQSDTVITLEFRDGSLQMGMEEHPTKGVPRYGIEWIEGLDRLVLNISGLIYWDYKVWDDEIKDTPILGIFKQIPVDDADEMLTRLYINLKGEVAYKVEEKDNLLILSLRAMPEEERTDFYVMLNAFEEYTDGTISAEEGLLPTLCSDKINVMLISKPFATEEAANAFLEEKKGTLLPNLSGKNAAVRALKNNQLPDFDEKGALSAYANATVTRKMGEESSAPVLITNGKLLCWRPDGMAYVHVTPFFLGANDGSELTSYEKIYISSVDTNTPTLLTDFEYTSIIKAEFSANEQYLAFLEEDDSNRLLYIYDFKSNTNQVATASEAGFGADTANFAWGSGEYANTIFAITGEGEMLQLMSYTLSESGAKVETLVENAFTGGSMGFFEGKVYYAQSAEEESQSGIFSFDPATRAISRVCDGEDFDLNQKTGMMSIISRDSDEITTYNTRTKVQKSVVKGKEVFSAVWSGDGSVLFYTVYKYNADSNERYKLAMYQYNPRTEQTVEVMDIITGEFKPSNKSSEVLMTYIYVQEDRYFVPITYRIDVS